MLQFIDALSDFFTTGVGTYWCYMYVGIGILICFLVIYDNIRK